MLPLAAGGRFEADVSRSRDRPRSRYADLLEQEIVAVLRSRERVGR